MRCCRLIWTFRRRRQRRIPIIIVNRNRRIIVVVVVVATFTPRAANRSRDTNLIGVLRCIEIHVIVTSAARIANDVIV
jgi:hypothetical protein